MEAIESPEGAEAVNDRATVWRDRGSSSSSNSSRHRDLSARPPACFPRVLYYLLVTIHSGTSDNLSKYDSERPGSEGAFRVFEPEETSICQPRDATFQCLTVDPAWLHETAAGMLQRERPLPHFPSHFPVLILR